MHDREEFGLRPVSEGDRDVLLRWRNSERIRSVMFTDHIISPEEHEAWLCARIGEQEPRVLVFEFRGAPLGAVTIDRVDPASSRCHWGFYVGEEQHPVRSGSLLGFLALEYLFERRGMRKVCGECFAFNERGVAFHRKMGFTQEGRFVRHQVKNGTYEDVIVFAMFREDWLRARPRLERLCFEEENDR